MPAASCACSSPAFVCGSGVLVWGVGAPLVKTSAYPIHTSGGGGGSCTQVGASATTLQCLRGCRFVVRAGPCRGGTVPQQTSEAAVWARHCAAPSEGNAPPYRARVSPVPSFAFTSKAWPTPGSLLCSAVRQTRCPLSLRGGGVYCTCYWERGRRLRCTRTMHSPTCVSAVVCVARKPRPCLSFSRRRDRIDLVLWRSYHKGGGGGGHDFCEPMNSEVRSNLQVQWVKLSVGHWRTAAHPLLCISVAHPQASSCLLFCDRKVPMVLQATDEPIFFLRFCAACRQCTRDIAQSSFGGARPPSSVPPGAGGGGMVL